MVDGDIEAAIQLRDLAAEIESYLDPETTIERLVALNEQDKALTAGSTILALRCKSESWPVTLPAIPELRQMVIEEFETWGVGSTSGLDITSRPKPRDFNGDTRTGFTYYFFNEVKAYREWFGNSREARAAMAKSDFPDDIKEAFTTRDRWEKMAVDLPEISSNHRVKSKWVDVIMERISNEIGGKFEDAEFPEFIHKRAVGMVRKGTKNGPVEKAVREFVGEGIDKIAASFHS